METKILVFQKEDFKRVKMWRFILESMNLDESEEIVLVEIVKAEGLKTKLTR